MRQQLISEIRQHYKTKRLEQIDSDFLFFEEDMAPIQDLEKIIYQIKSSEKIQENKHNSILLYVTGITNDFDFTKHRCDTVDGSPPDIDIDFDAAERQKVIDWVVQEWGRENVANIITHGTLGTRSLIQRFFKMHELPATQLKEITKKIPKAVHGKEPTFEDFLKKNPELESDPSYKNFTNTSLKLQNLVANFGVHAAGLVISDNPIWNQVPLWSKKEKEFVNGKNVKIEKWVTQYDMKEVEELGLIKFDFLSIDNLSIIKETIKLLKDKGIELNPYELEESLEAYKMMEDGLLAGIFQMETSGTAKDLIYKMKPKSISELSDISALNRPGPMQAGLDKMYIENKERGSPPDDMPEKLSKILEDTYWTLVYQEQVMKLCTDLAGFTLQEADDVRRAMGKKKADVLAKWKDYFIQGVESHSKLPKSFAEELWILLAGDPEKEDDNGFADYCLSGDQCVAIYDYHETNPEDALFFIQIKDIVKEKISAHALTMPDHAAFEEVSLITQFYPKGKQQTYKYTLENNKSIVCTPEHKFCVIDQNGDVVKISIDEIYEKQIDLLEAPNVMYSN